VPEGQVKRDGDIFTCCKFSEEEGRRVDIEVAHVDLFTAFDINALISIYLGGSYDVNSFSDTGHSQVAGTGNDSALPGHGR
jgi:hypothetical protein